eukprot:m.27320 g.27320  ORF g.27320 m.27320 type:complete len:190 (-) comp10224_c0_seq1:101-670(-)
MEEIVGQDRIVWVDLEMSGLDIHRERILEMAMIITEADLTPVAKSDIIIIHQPDHILDSMDEWNTNQHGGSGLVAKVKESKIREWEAEDYMLALLQQHVPKGKCPLAGSSVHVDRQFLLKYMPRFMEHLNYRIIDVSSIVELCYRWNPSILRKMPAKKSEHRALDDIQDSIDKLRFFKKHFFKLPKDNK